MSGELPTFRETFERQRSSLEDVDKWKNNAVAKVMFRNLVRLSYHVVVEENNQKT